MAVDLGKTMSDTKVNALVAKDVLGWKNVHRDRKNGKPDEVWAKKPDKLGRWRRTKVPNFCGDSEQTAAIENRLRQLGRFELYMRELAKIASKKGLPAGWATPDQRCRAALKALGKRAQRAS
jgi:hypothetical protein